MSLVTMGMGDDGSGLEVAVVVDTPHIEVEITELPPIEIEVKPHVIEIDVSNIVIGTDLDPHVLEIEPKEC